MSYRTSITHRRNKSKMITMNDSNRIVMEYGRWRKTRNNLFCVHSLIQWARIDYDSRNSRWLFNLVNDFFSIPFSVICLFCDSSFTRPSPKNIVCGWANEMHSFVVMLGKRCESIHLFVFWNQNILKDRISK